MRLSGEFESTNTGAAGVGNISKTSNCRSEQATIRKWISQKLYVKTLPGAQRDVMLVLKVSGLSLEEAARATGSTVAPVKQKAYRAYETLHKRFGEHEL
jgi:DNA-directed RNA polymerase specialized sigma24 family protein